MAKRLNVRRLRRVSEDGTVEELDFRSGVNLLVGPPNAGKTLWLRMLDHILGDPETFESRFGQDIACKYHQLRVELMIDKVPLVVERRTQQAGLKSKVIVDGVPRETQEFQRDLMVALGIPIITFPKGSLNLDHAVSLTQSWPELSFRTLYRHMYRQQRFWGDLADKQFDSEVNACVLQFLGLAPVIFSSEVLELRSLWSETNRLADGAAAFEEVLEGVLRSRDVPAELAEYISQPHERRGDEYILELRDHLEELEKEITSSSRVLGELLSQLRDIGRNDDVRSLWSTVEILCQLNLKKGEGGERSRIARLVSGFLGRHSEKLNEARSKIAKLSMNVSMQDLSELIRDRTFRLSDAMNEYLDSMNRQRPGTWKHKDVEIRSFRKNELSFRVDKIRWNRSLGGTDSLFFLMAYHYGLMSLACDRDCNYPGFLVIDLPAYFWGQSITDKEAFIISPFIELLGRSGHEGCQVILAGSAFGDEGRCHRVVLERSYQH